MQEVWSRNRRKKYMQAEMSRIWHKSQGLGSGLSLSKQDT